ncbi:MAG TPA: tol-pal system protein YbgF [Thermoanaerobaculia bacterium]|nr:tol-pal system protein YbgF [Thermoanaerobaculia bacterium]
MRRLLGSLALLAAASCASTAAEDDGPLPPPPAPNVEARLAEVQTALTELLERLDVMNERLSRLEQGVAAQPASAQASEPARDAAKTPRALRGARLADDYRNALVMYGKGKYGEARSAFQAVFDADPGGDLADNALYWIGETYFAAGDFHSAVRFYQRVVNDFGEGNKAPDALFKMALAQEKSGDLALARRTLQSLIDRYPYSTASDSAKAELRRIAY